MNRSDTVLDFDCFDEVLPRPTERRKWLRLLTRRETSCLLTLDGVMGLWALKVQNLSPGGAKLLVSRSIPNEQIRALGFVNRAEGHCCERAIWKVYDFRLLNGVTVLGVAFTQDLTPHDLEKLR